MTPFKLTLDAVKAAAREAYAKGELGFQKGEQSCQYKGDRTGAPCAVGAALPQELRDHLATRLDFGHPVGWINGQGVSSLVREGILEIENDFEESAISRIQREHDNVILEQKFVSSRGGYPENVQIAIQRFEEIIAEE